MIELLRTVLIPEAPGILIYENFLQNISGEEPS